MAAWMLATILERPFLCEVFPSVAELDLGIEPVYVDWRHGYTEYSKQKGSVKVLKTNRASRFLNHPQATDYTVAIEITQTTPAMVPLVKAYIEKVLLGNGSILDTEEFVGNGKQFTDDDASLISHQFRNTYAHAHYCATRSLFRPTKAMLHLIDTTLERFALKDTPSPFTIGVHVRFGGKWNDRKRARDSDAIHIVRCGWNMTQSAARGSNLLGDTNNYSTATATATNQNTPPIKGLRPPQPTLWLLASDNIQRLGEIISHFAKQELPQGAWENANITLGINEGGEVEHVSKSDNGTSTASIQRLWHDWFLLSESHTCTLVRSSFPRTACYASKRRDDAEGLVQQMVTTLDLGRYPRHNPVCGTWRMNTAK
jgi:hypothetical protein